VQQVISNRTQASRIDTQLQQLITAASADNDIWFASRVPLSTFAQRLQEGTQSSFRGSQVLQAVQTATGSVRFGDPIRITLNAVSQSEKDASALADVIRFGADLLQMQSEPDQRSQLISSALKSMELSNQGTSVHLELLLPEASVEQLAQISPNRRHTVRRQ